MFCKEVITWKALRHPNVLPLLGVTMGRAQFAMVSEWMTNGNINEYVEKRTDVNRFELVKFQTLLLDPLTTNDLAVLTAQGCRSGTYIYARRGDDPWGLKGCKSRNTDVIQSSDFFF